MVQDTLHRTFTRLASFQPKHDGALRAYLRNAVENRIRDEMRRAVRQPTVDGPVDRHPSADSHSALDKVILEETWDRYKSALKQLPRRDQRLIVGRLELGYTFRQLAAVDGRASHDAVRMALNRALVRLAAEMGDDGVSRAGE